MFIHSSRDLLVFLAAFKSQRVSGIVLFPFLLLNFVFSGVPLQILCHILFSLFFKRVSDWFSFTATLSGTCSLIFRCYVLSTQIGIKNSFILQSISSCTAFSHSLDIWVKLYSYIFHLYTAIPSNINATSSTSFDKFMVHSVLSTWFSRSYIRWFNPCRSKWSLNLLSTFVSTSWL